MTILPITSHSHPDARLIENAQKDPEQFELLYRKYSQRVYRYFWYRVGHERETAEDLTQVTFLRAFARLAFYRNQGNSFLAYLYRIAHNVLVNYYRSKKTVSLELATDLPGNALESMQKDIVADDLWRAIRDLKCSDNDAFCFILKHLRGIPLKDLANMTGRTVNAVKIRLSRARKRLSRHPSFAGFTDFEQSEA